MEKKKVEFIAVIGIFSLLAVIVLYNFVRLPKSGTAAKKREAPGSYRAQLLETELRVKRLPRQRQEVADLEKKADAYRNEVPFESDNTWLSRQINSIASETGARDVSQRYLQTAPPSLKLDKEWEGKYDEKTWEIRMRCGYHELGRFLSKLEGVNRFLEVTDISIEGNEPGGQKVVLVIHYLVRKPS
ncbi:MAG: type 4a pilus biogenesis protein PilO [Candidatus Aureabacteria bacterium]|nr:type 4a pilus biogenesis protein PilO [Candidatus Auribacterota bacterium]